MIGSTFTILIYTYLTPANPAGPLLEKVNASIGTYISSLSNIQEMDAEKILTNLKDSKIQRRNTDWDQHLKGWLEFIQDKNSFDFLISEHKTVDKFNKSRKREGLSGWGPKLQSLFCCALEDLEIADAPKDAFAVDVHIFRICLQLGYIELDFHDRDVLQYHNIGDALYPLLSREAQKRGISPSQLQSAMWYLGSTYCQKCINHDMSDVCPVYNQCKGPLNTQQYHAGKIKSVEFYPKANK